MKIAFCIIAHTPHAVLDTLIRTLSSDPDFLVILHIDSASDIRPFREYEKMAHLMSERRNTLWGNFNLVLATIDMYRVAVDRGADHMFLLSGDDMPIVDNSRIKEFMATRLDHQFISSFKPWPGIAGPVNRIRWNYNQRFYRKRVPAFDSLLKNMHRVFCLMGFNRNPYYKKERDDHWGSAWHSISRDFAMYIIGGLDDGTIERRLYERAQLPDESFFQNVVWNSKFRETLDPAALACKELNSAPFRYIDWKTGPDFPRLLNAEDFEKIKASGCFFCRKVDPRCAKEYAEYFQLNAPGKV